MLFLRNSYKYYIDAKYKQSEWQQACKSKHKFYDMKWRKTLVYDRIGATALV